MPVDVLVVGGGMITHDQILPSLYHMQRLGQAGEIRIAATSSARLKQLVSPRFAEAFPGQSFVAYPPLDSPEDRRSPDLWKDALATLAPDSLVVVASPDETHNEIVRKVLEREQNVLCVKPLTHNYEQAEAIGRMAHERGLLVTIDYHKRFDRRSLEARKLYRLGVLGEFACGQACMIEPYYYRSSNFQNWFTKDKTDAFTYVGCHYVDFVYFVTGLKPIEVSARGVERKFPNGNMAHMWANGRVVFENGSLLSVNGGLGYPDRGPGTNDQGITMYCEGPDGGGIIQHNDQFRGVGYGFVDDRFGAHFRHINPDYFRLVPWQGAGLKPVGYGYDSVEAPVIAVLQLRDRPGLPERQKMLAEIDERGLCATPRNSSINELVIEATRRSIQDGGSVVKIEYGERPGIA
ncbi:MAG: Gfo/Idh/MocA family oxidoreductase [Pirellulales bacterium]